MEEITEFDDYIGASSTNEDVRKSLEEAFGEIDAKWKIYKTNRELVEDFISGKEDFSHAILHHTGGGMSGITASRALLKHRYEGKINIIASSGGTSRILNDYAVKKVNLRMSEISGPDIEGIRKLIDFYR